MAASHSDGFLSRLPLETKTLICEYLCDHCCVGWATSIRTTSVTPMSSQPLRDLCLVSKSMREAAQPVLFHFFSEVGSHSKRNFYKVRALERSTRTTPWLAQKIRSLSFRYISTLHCPFDSAAVHLQSRYDTRVSLLLERATHVEQLHLEYGFLGRKATYWIPSANHFSHLRELSLVTTFESHKMDAKLISAFIASKPRLEKLVLWNYTRFDGSISHAVRNIRHLEFRCLSHFVVGPVGIDTLVQAMPLLESIVVCRYHGILTLGPSQNVTADLLARRDALKSLTLHYLMGEDELTLLDQFPNLYELDITASGVSDRASVRLPPRLKRLVLRQHGMHIDDIHKTLEALEGSIRLCKDLEIIRVILEKYQDRPSAQKLHSEVQTYWAAQKASVQVLIIPPACLRCCDLKQSWGMSSDEMKYTQVGEVI